MNKVFLIGRLAKDPEVRYTSNGKAVCSCSLAVPKSFAKDEVDFIPIVVWGKTAENMAEYTEKGQKIAVAGRIQVRKYTDSEGRNKQLTEVVADEVQFLEKPSGGGGNTNIGNDDDVPF